MSYYTFYENDYPHAIFATPVPGRFSFYVFLAKEGALVSTHDYMPDALRAFYALFSIYARERVALRTTQSTPVCW